MPRQFAMVVAESSYGVPKTSPVLGVDSHYLPINQSNAVGVQETPILGKIQHAGGYNTQGCAYSAQTQVAGQIQLQLWATPLTKFLLDLSLVKIDPARSKPFATTDAGYVMPPGDLASFTLYFGHEQVDGTIRRYGYHGLKVLSGSLGASAQSTAGTLSLTVQGSTTSTPDAALFPVPGDDDFPCSLYTFSDTDGGFKVGGVRSLYGGVEYAWTNNIAPKYYEGRYAKLMKFTGRQSTITVNELYMRPTPDDHGSFKSTTPMEGEIGFDNGADVLTLNFPIVRWETLTPDYSLENEFFWSGSLTSYYDAAIGGDVAVAFGPSGGEE